MGRIIKQAKGLIPYSSYKDKIKPGDRVVFQCLVETFDFYMVGGAGAAQKAHFQEYVVDDINSYRMMLKEPGKKSSSLYTPLKDIKENPDGTATFQIGPDFHIIEPMIFAVWIIPLDTKRAE